jgi:NAD(P)-dependent dehydrogenase (short-subunit alcohol dehydrogenase family)
MTSMQGKTCVITGATSGIGQATAEALAAMGARVVMVARSRARGEQTLARLLVLSPGVAHRVHYADLSRLAEMKRVAAEIALAEPRIDVLINNAGALFSYRQVTEEGLERTFAINHLAYFVLTHGLRERLFAAAPARVINTASSTHKRAKLDLDDLQSQHGYNGVYVYERSKLCNILFTRELARRFAGSGVSANSLHPGVVATRMGNQSGGLVPPLFGIIKFLFGISAEQGAQTTVYLASSPDVVAITGSYFEKCRQALPSREAENDDNAQRLWIETTKLAKIEW